MNSILQETIHNKDKVFGASHKFNIIAIKSPYIKIMYSLTHKVAHHFQ